MILVTGATGFLGKRVCRHLDKMNKPYVKTSQSMGHDLRDSQQCDEIISRVKPTYVLHCASYVGGIQFGLKHPAEIYKNNLSISINLFESCYKHNVRRLINPISNCAYPGDATLFKESQFWNGPLHDSVLFYGMVRKMSLIGAQAYAKQYNLDTINLILSNMYGPGDHFDEERSHALGALIMKIVTAKNTNASSITVWGSGTPVREWLYVDDGAKAMILACECQPYLDIINIGVAKGISIRDMAILIKDIVRYNGELIFDTTKADGAPYKTVDGTTGERILGWKPEMGFADGVRRTIDWYINNKN